MKDYYKIAKELGLNPKKIDFATLIDALVEKAVDVDGEKQQAFGLLAISNRSIKTLKTEIVGLKEIQDKLAATKKRLQEKVTGLVATAALVK